MRNKKPLKYMEKVKIKRVKRVKKTIGKKEKILAGLGVGAGLMGVAGVKPAPSQKPLTAIVAQENKDGKDSISSKIRKTLSQIFSIPKAKAESGDSFSISGETGGNDDGGGFYDDSTEPDDIYNDPANQPSQTPPPVDTGNQTRPPSLTPSVSTEPDNPYENTNPADQVPPPPVINTQPASFPETTVGGVPFESWDNGVGTDAQGNKWGLNESGNLAPIATAGTFSRTVEPIAVSPQEMFNQYLKDTNNPDDYTIPADQAPGGISSPGEYTPNAALPGELTNLDQFNTQVNTGNLTTAQQEELPTQIDVSGDRYVHQTLIDGDWVDTPQTGDTFVRSDGEKYLYQNGSFVPFNSPAAGTNYADSSILSSVQGVPDAPLEANSSLPAQDTTPAGDTLGLYERDNSINYLSTVDNSVPAVDAPATESAQTGSDETEGIEGSSLPGGTFGDFGGEETVKLDTSGGLNSEGTYTPQQLYNISQGLNPNGESPMATATATATQPAPVANNVDISQGDSGRETMTASGTYPQANPSTPAPEIAAPPEVGGQVSTKVNPNIAAVFGSPDVPTAPDAGEEPLTDTSSSKKSSIVGSTVGRAKRGATGTIAAVGSLVGGNNTGYFGDTYSGKAITGEDGAVAQIKDANKNKENLYNYYSDSPSGIYSDSTDNTDNTELYVQSKKGAYVYTGVTVGQLNVQAAGSNPASNLVGLNGDALQTVGNGTFRDSQNNLYVQGQGDYAVLTGLQVVTDGQGHLALDVDGYAQVRARDDAAALFAQQDAIEKAVDKNLEALSGTGLTVTFGSDNQIHIAGKDWEGETVMPQTAFATRVISVDESGVSLRNIAKSVGNLGLMSTGVGGAAVVGASQIPGMQGSQASPDSSQPIILYNKNTHTAVVMDASGIDFVGKDGATSYEFTQDQMKQILQGGTANGTSLSDLSNWIPKGGASGTGKKVLGKIMPVLPGTGNNPSSRVISAWAGVSKGGKTGQNPLGGKP